MPLSFDPNSTAEFWLASDREKPAAQRPVFLVKFMRQRELDEYRRLMTEAEACGEDQQALRLAWQAIIVGVAGWRNFTDPDSGKPLEFCPEAVGQVLTVREFWELAIGYPSSVQLMGPDLKNCLSPSCPATVASAPTAAAAAT